MSAGGPTPAAAYSMAPARVAMTVLPRSTRARGNDGAPIVTRCEARRRRHDAETRQTYERPSPHSLALKFAARCRRECCHDDTDRSVARLRRLDLGDAAGAD